MKLHRKYLDVINCLPDNTSHHTSYAFKHIKIDKNGMFATNGHFCISYPLENPEEFTFSRSVFIHIDELTSILKLISKKFPYVNIIQEGEQFFIEIPGNDIKISIKNELTDEAYPNTEYLKNIYKDQEPKLQIGFDAIYIKILAEQIIKLNEGKESQLYMTFNFYDLENLEKRVDITFEKNNLVNTMMLMPLRIK